MDNKQTTVPIGPLSFIAQRINHVRRFAALRPGTGLLALILVFSSGCGGEVDLPRVGSDDYTQAVSLFQSAVARIQIGEERGAEFRLMQATALAPGEPAVWYNLGLLALRSNRLDSAASYLDRARVLAVDGNSSIQLLSGHIAAAMGFPEEAETFFRSAVDSDQANLHAVFALEQVLAARLDSASTGEALVLNDRILEVHPDNIAAHIERLRLGLRSGDGSVVQESLIRLDELITETAESAQRAVEMFRGTGVSTTASTTSQTLVLLESTLESYPSYRLGRERFLYSEHDIAAPIPLFLRLPNPPSGAFPADRSLEYTRESSDLPAGKWSWFGVPVLDDKGIPISIGASGRVVQIGPDSSITFDRELVGVEPARHVVIPLDYDYDYRVDLAVAGPGGLAVLRQDSNGGYDDVTESLDLPMSVIRGSYRGGWSTDYDSEGDMDLVLAVEGESPVVLRNNGDGSFRQVDLFREASDVKETVWLDTDADGDLDALFLARTGEIVQYVNEGAGRFTAATPPIPLPSTRAMSIADLNYDGYMDLILLTADGRVVQSTPAFGLLEWAPRDVAAHSDLTAGSGSDRFTSLHIGDLDNSGSQDVVASFGGKTVIWLMDAEGVLVLHTEIQDLNVFEVMDLVGIGRQDLVGFDLDGTPVQMMNSGNNGYKSRTIEQQTASALGDRRINSYGIGGRIEMKAGLHYQQRIISSPVIHFGLGNRTSVETVRIIWPNGVAQSLFDLETDQAIIAREGLNASCPWIYTVTETGVQFLEDFMMRSPLGFRVDQTEFMKLGNGEDRIKIDGKLLSEVDGAYDLRLAAELWEAVYVDRLSLVAVDHPEGTEIYLDETFSDPQRPLEPILMGLPIEIAGAWDDAGRNVTTRVLSRDGVYLDGFELGRNFGQAEDHYVEIDLGTGFVPGAPAWLVAEGWLRASTSAISLAISQAREPAVPTLNLEYQDAAGEWIQSSVAPGIPWGSNKSLVVDLAEVLPRGSLPRIRIRTNLEISWDRIFWAKGPANAALQRKTLSLASTELRYRGFSVIERGERSVPDVPDYDQIASRKPVWLDPSGYYTRYGPVTELLLSADDRYAIMSPGDELVLRFAVPKSPEEGMVRDFVLVASGWTKDGSPATEHSTTVRPLPSLEYPYPSEIVALRDDPVYRRFSRDWENYHTRYVGRALTGLNSN